MKHTIVLNSLNYTRAEVKKLLNDLTSIHNIDLEVRYAAKETQKTNKRTKV